LPLNDASLHHRPLPKSRAESNVQAASTHQVSVSVDIFEQLSRLHLQCPRDLTDVRQADILAAPLDTPYISGVKSGPLRQLFLGQLPPKTEATNGLPKLNVDVWHAATFSFFKLLGKR
jgi:hypothetical protein